MTVVTNEHYVASNDVSVSKTNVNIRIKFTLLISNSKESKSIQFLSSNSRQIDVHVLDLRSISGS